MTISNILNAAGLFLDIIGVIMLFKYGLPPDISKDGHVVFVSIEVDENEIKRGKKYTVLSYTALSFLVIGFIFQLLANFTPWIYELFHKG